MLEEARLPGETEAALRFERLLAELSASFINLPPGEVDREIVDGLGMVCAHLGLDLAVLWQWSETAPGVIVATHIHPRGGRRLPSR